MAIFSTLFKQSEQCDVLVLGSGAAGLTAAILAHDKGARVTIIERTDKIGGTSAVSGGGIWIPNNHHMSEVGANDSREDALAYCKALSMGRVDGTLLEAYVDTAPQMLQYLEQHSLLRFTPITTPDYHPEAVGGKLKGRSVEPAPFDASVLGEWRSKLRPPSMMTFSMTLQEIYQTYQAFYRPWVVPQSILVERMEKSVVTLGQALVAGLLAAVIQRNIPIRLNARAKELMVRRGRVVGARVAALENDSFEDITAKKGVILATAGFEWNADMRARFLPGDIPHPNSPPFNDGDGLLMAMSVGADLSNMSEVWNYPSLLIPGDSYEGHPLARGIKAERSGPHIIWVNSNGQRFVNESANYNSVGKAFYNLDSGQPQYANVPAWAILDHQFRSRYMVGTATPDDPDPSWLIVAESVRELAEKVGIDADTLERTVERWNTNVANGRDADFYRGDSAFDRYQGDQLADHPNLGSITQPPFYALPIQPGALGTKGGPRTNSRAQVMNINQTPIHGLYAAGNVAASIAGPSYFGVGSTLGPAMTWGFIAGVSAAVASS